MLVDIDLRIRSAEEIQRLQNYIDSHNAQHPNEPMSMKTFDDRVVRHSRGFYMCYNLERETQQTLVEDVPEFMDYRNPTRTADDRLRTYLEDARRYKRSMDKLYSQRYKRGPYRNFMSLGAYGLCDSPEQLMELYPHLDDDDVPRVVGFQYIVRKNQSPQGGFRYHKNGNYVGRQRPRHEYLYDDTHIDHIISFHIYRVEGVITG